MVDLRKRQILKFILGSSAVAAGCHGLLTVRQSPSPGIEQASNRGALGSKGIPNRQIVEPLLPDQTEFLRSFGFSQQQVDQMLLNARKMQTPDRISPDDVYLTEAQRTVMPGTIARLGRIQRHFGHGYFNNLGFNQLLKSAALDQWGWTVYG